MDAIRRRSLLVGLVVLLAGSLPARAAAIPALTVLPQRGPAGTTFTLTGSDLKGQATVALVVYTLVPNPAGGATNSRAQKTVFDRAVPVDDTGALAVALDSAAFTPGDYIAALPQVPGRPQLTFTVVGTPTGLPNTGGGWGATGTVKRCRAPTLSRYDEHPLAMP